MGVHELELASVLRAWGATQDTAGSAGRVRVEVHRADVEAEDPRRGPAPPTVTLHETQIAALQALLDEDARARSDQPSTTPPARSDDPLEDLEDPLGELRATAARLTYLLDGHLDPRFRRRPPGHGIHHPQDAAAALAQLRRSVTAAAALIDSVGAAIGLELQHGRMLPVASGHRSTSGTPPGRPAALVDQVRAKTTAARRTLTGDVATLLERLRVTATLLHRTAAAVLAHTADGSTLAEHLVLECDPYQVRTMGRYHVRVFRPAGRLPVVVLGDLADNPSTVVANTAEGLAALVAAHVLGGIGPQEAVWVAYEAAERFADSHQDYDARVYGPDIDELADVLREDQLTRLVFTEDEEDARPFAHVEFQEITFGELEALAGGSVRRWHARDHTSPRLGAEGVAQVRIPAGGP